MLFEPHNIGTHLKGLDTNFQVVPSLSKFINCITCFGTNKLFDFVWQRSNKDQDAKYITTTATAST